MKFNLTSKSFKDGDILPKKHVLNLHGCTGLNISPNLKWENAPFGTKTFAIISHDPDAPVENGWYHWIVLNIPEDINEIEEGIKFNSPIIEPLTTFNKSGYGGACPPVGHGIHHYNFTVYALDFVIDKSISLMKPFEIENFIKQKAIDKASICAIYERK